MLSDVLRVVEPGAAGWGLIALLSPVPLTAGRESAAVRGLTGGSGPPPVTDRPFRVRRIARRPRWRTSLAGGSNCWA